MNFFFKALLDTYFSIKFAKHNKFHFKTKSFFKKNNDIILTEMVGLQSSQIPISYLLNALSKKFNCKLMAYNFMLEKNFFKKIFWNVLRFFKLKDFLIYSSFGVDNFFYIKVNKNQKKYAKKIYEKVLTNIKDKEDVLRISIDNITIGDLIYDHYLMKYKLPTIDINSLNFKNFLLISIQVYIFWKDFFKNYNVKALNVSHCVYLVAIPLRIAVHNKIPVYQTKYQSLYKLDCNNIYEHEEFKYFSKTFSLMSKKDKQKGMRLGKQLLIKKLSGNVIVDSSESTKSAYLKEVSKERIIKDTNKIKVLILTHCFFDSPHSYGANIFVDFYEWIDFLGKMSERTDYDWYIKLHPDYIDGTKKIIENFLHKYKKIHYIPPNISHHQIIKEGINFALTVYGTVGAEYAYKKIPVINASCNNPHICYKFNIHPKDLKEYKSVILNLEKMKIKIDVKKVYEFFFMRNIYYWHDWLVLGYREFINKIGGFKNQFSYLTYKQWLKNFNAQNHRKIIATFNNFIDSNSYVLEKKHISK
jgi:hypothetical protein